jgi:hypothetical protein
VRHGSHSHRHFRLALRAVARDVLSRKLPQHAELKYAASILTVIEINGSFYSLQRPSSYARWYADTPKGFVFSVKGPRYITHMLRLRNAEAPLANFFASGLSTCARKWVRSSGSSRRASGTTMTDLRLFLICCPTTRKRLWPSRAGAMHA